VKLFHDLIPSFPTAVWMYHNDQDIANNLTNYYAQFTRNDKIMSSFPMRVFLEQIDLSGKVCIITGASSGIGQQTALELAQLKCHVILACRNKEKTLEVGRLISKETGNSKVEFMKLNLASLASVQAFASKFKESNLPLHYLILNAGIASTMPVLTEDGFESIMGINHISHFALVNALIGFMTSSKIHSRILAVSSDTHRVSTGINLSTTAITKQISSMDIFDVYNTSKLANCLFIRELAKKLPSHVTANIVNPGTAVATDLYRDLPQVLQWGIKGVLTPASEATYSIIRGALDTDLSETTGAYIDSDGSSRKPSAEACNDILARQLWKFTEECIELAMK